MQKKTRWMLLGLAAGAAWFSIARRRNIDKATRWNRHMERAGSTTAAGSLTAAVTGASSGIGEAYAKSLAARSYHLVLIARRVERMKQQAADYEKDFGIHVEVLPADLSTGEGIERVEQRLANGDIDFLVNCAGYDVFGDFTRIPVEKILGLINCLELATVRLTRAALPSMLERRRGAVVNVSSIGAFGPKRKDALYVASKAFINRFTESLALELRNTGVRIQALCPGFTLTEFHDAPEYAAYHIKERLPRWMWMRSEQVVAESWQALGIDQVVCVPGFKNRLAVAAARSGLSQWLMRFLASFFPSSMKTGEPDAGPGDLLVCPECHGRLERAGSGAAEPFFCPACSRQYPVVNGIPRFAGYESLNRMDRRFAGLYDVFSIFYRLFSKVAFTFIGTTEDTARFELMEKLQPRGRVLEVSIGPGVNLPYLREYPAVREIYGLDLSNGQLAVCRRYARAQGWPVHLYQGNAECLPFQNNAFDSVFHFGGINFFGDKQTAIAELIRVAKPGAKILIGDELERSARAYELTLPGFKKSFQGQREPVKPPVDLVPAAMEELVLDDTAWKGWFYTLEFKKPCK